MPQPDFSISPIANGNTLALIQKLLDVKNIAPVMYYAGAIVLL